MANKHTILVTGASSGIGAACAAKFAAQGFTVYASVRKEKDAEALKKIDNNIRPLILDVCDSMSIANAYRRISQEMTENETFSLINNAGAVAMIAPLECVNIDDARQQLEVNVIGTLAVTQAFMPLLRQTQGRVVMVTSLSGRVAFPFWGAYVASKFALEGMTDALRMETQGQGIKVSIVEPGPIKTSIWERSRSRSETSQKTFDAQRLQPYEPAISRYLATVGAPDKNAVSVDCVVQVIETALRATNPKPRYRVGQAKIVAPLAWLLPSRWMDAILRKQFGL
ncbi:MAG: SDR family NAD(P)-dependent oxidoreductase [Gammaproteobacteria bacterium]|nr:SDR family NAD(P)-dependent oxidoreductase [Gammaproteobacteria bacterium]